MAAPLLTRWPSVRVRVGYVLGVAAFTVLLLLVQGAGVDVLLMAVGAVPLGPLGLLLVVLALLTQGLLAILTTGSLTGTSVQLPGVLVADAIVLLAVVGVALVNVRILQRAAASTSSERIERYRSQIPIDADRLLAGSAHLYAGIGFVLLSLLCGITALFGRGLDVSVTAAQADARTATAGLLWAVGFAAATAGLAVWVVRAARNEAMFGWALASLGVQTALLAAVLLND